MRSAADILCAAAATYVERHKVYGKNWPKIACMLQAMFPDGITLRTEEDFTRFYFLVSIVQKLTRYGNNFSNGGHYDSALDISVYAAMMAATDDKDPDPV
jgi:hypothetical protein